MALDGNRLGDAIRAAVDAAADPTDREELFRAIGNAIVDEIVNNASVSTSVNVTSVSGVTAGSATSGPGSGSGSGGIT